MTILTDQRGVSIRSLFIIKALSLEFEMSSVSAPYAAIRFNVFRRVTVALAHQTNEGPPMLLEIQEDISMKIIAPLSLVAGCTKMLFARGALYTSCFRGLEGVGVL